MTMSEPARLIHRGGSSRSMYSNTACSPGRQMEGTLREGFPSAVWIDRPLAARRKNRAARNAAV
jgi:hypothetical protein